MKILTSVRTKLLNAGPKAQNDIISILKKEYDIEEDTILNNSSNLIWKIKRLLLILRNVFFEDILIIQHPITQSKFVRLLPNRKTIVIVHDLNCIRFPDAKNNFNEIKNLNHFKYIIVHNYKMKRYLVEKGIDENKLYINELFDYLCVKDKKNKNRVHDKIQLVYAGNLKKSEFIYQLNHEKMNFILNIYGQGVKEYDNRKIIYKGVFDSNRLPTEWDGNIGLVWDGNFDESDENIGVKNYTKYNNPHKLSCYIAAGIPVIVWKKSAIAKLVEQYDIGYTINNIYDINNINFENYEEKKKNVILLSDKVRNGFFTKKVIESVINDIKEGDKI